MAQNKKKIIVKVKESVKSLGNLTEPENSNSNSTSNSISLSDNNAVEVDGEEPPETEETDEEGV